MATTRKCNECGEWYDARAKSCYICGEEDRQLNIAAIKAAEASRMNGALAAQMSSLQGEARAEQDLHAARQDPSGEAFGRVRPRVPGYGDLVQGMKDSMEEHPEVLDWFHHRGTDD